MWRCGAPAQEPDASCGGRGGHGIARTARRAPRGVLWQRILSFGPEGGLPLA